jgi:hypothetical protein
MSTIRPEFLYPDLSDHSVAAEVRVREEPEEDEEEDEDDMAKKMTRRTATATATRSDPHVCPLRF